LLILPMLLGAFSPPPPTKQNTSAHMLNQA
jgi:hypothetical protein